MPSSANVQQKVQPPVHGSVFGPWFHSWLIYSLVLVLSGLVQKVLVPSLVNDGVLPQSGLTHLGNMTFLLPGKPTSAPSPHPLYPLLCGVDTHHLVLCWPTLLALLGWLPPLPSSVLLLPALDNCHHRCFFPWHLNFHIKLQILVQLQLIKKTVLFRYTTFSDKQLLHTASISGWVMVCKLLVFVLSSNY